MRLLRENPILLYLHEGCLGIAREKFPVSAEEFDEGDDGCDLDSEGDLEAIRETGCNIVEVTLGNQHGWQVVKLISQSRYGNSFISATTNPAWRNRPTKRRQVNLLSRSPIFSTSSLLIWPILVSSWATSAVVARWS